MLTYPKVRILDMATVAEATLQITLQKPPDFHYFPGQYIFITPNINVFKGVAFSLASAPHEPHLKVTMRLSGSPFKNAIQSLKIGSTMQIQGPYGRLSLPRDTQRPVAMIAGGIGITPFRSMILESVTKDFPHEIFLFYGNRSFEASAYLDDFASIKHPRFHLISVLEHPKENFTSETGYLREEILKKYIADKNPSYIVVGPPPMVEAIDKILTAMNVDKQLIVKERFTGYEKTTQNT